MKFFNAVRKNTSIGDGTVRDLVGWLERFINVIFPENGIEYWSGHEFPASARDIGRRPVPTSGFDPTSVHHVACYVRGGYSEGNIIEASLVLRDGTLFTLAWVKTFGKEDENWMIARALSQVLDSLIYWHEVPELVEMDRKLPRNFSHERISNLTETIELLYDEQHLTVRTASGRIFDQRDCSEFGVGAKWAVLAARDDWKTVLNSAKVAFVEVNQTTVANDQQKVTLSAA